MEISFIIPVFNGENSIEKSIGSILKWNREPKIEILVIDDGSTDGSGQLCDEIAWKTKRVSVLHQKNAGELSSYRISGAGRSNSLECRLPENPDS